ncbi:MAG: histidine phosphatase family protein, partial [SAR324 cluster bacterium]|nr:histidine phosphatase family protein [SAR324 cluster bacterium]
SGESTLDLLVRGLEFLEEIRKKHEGRKIGIVTHGGFISVILKYSLGMSQDTPTRFIIPNTSVHRIIWRKEKWVVSSMGDVFHLNGFQKS